jgi:hypothetical protein
MTRRSFLIVTAVAVAGSVAHGESAQRGAQPGVPALRFGQASGCAGLFLYTWNDDRTEVLTIRADRATVPLPNGMTTLDLAKSKPGVIVRVEVTPSPRDSLPFCSDESPAAGNPPAVWTATAGKIKISLQRRASAPFTPVSVVVENLVLRGSTGAEVKQRREIRFSAAVAELDK